MSAIVDSEGGAAPIVIIPIEHLDINFTTLIQNTLTQNTSIVLNADNGGTIAIGGDINAVSSQQALFD